MEPYAEQSSYAKYYAQKSPFDIRHVTQTIMLGADTKSARRDSGKQMVWMRADGEVDVHKSCIVRCWPWVAIRSCWSRCCVVPV